MAGILLAYFRTPRVQIAALLYFLTAGALTRVPLFHYLGFEFSAVMTIPAAFISGTLTIQFLREHRKKPLTRRTWLFVMGDYLLVQLLLLAIPLAVISLNALAVKNCAFGTGLLYFFLLPVVTVFFSVPLAMVIGSVFHRGVLVYSFVVAVILSQIAVITVTQPQLFAYNFILGYFPGITYDETLADLNRLILFREITVTAGILFFALAALLLRHDDPSKPVWQRWQLFAQSMRSDRVLWGVVAVCGGILLAGHFFRSSLGFEFSEEEIQEALGRRSESPSFIFYYDETTVTMDEMRRWKAEAEFHFRKAGGMLRIPRGSAKKISVYLYPSPASKQQFIGTTTTNIAKPWKREIHLSAESFHSSFRHELVHILAGDFGFPFIRASLLMGFNEGLAVAVDWEEGPFTPHQYAAALQREQALAAPERLFTLTGFADSPGSYAYLVSGSFCRYLIDRFGMERFQRAFPNGNFMPVFGASLHNLVRDWQAFLKTVDTSLLPKETVRSLFLQQSIFYKTCVREVAEQNADAVRLIQAKDFQGAEERFRASYANAATVSSMRGLFQSLNAQKKWDEVTALYEELPLESTLRQHPAVQLPAGDAAFLGGNIRSARRLYDNIREMFYSEAYTEAAALRMQWINDAVHPAVFAALTYGGFSDSLRLRHIDSVLALRPQAGALRYVRGLLMKDQLVSADELSALSEVPEYSTGSIGKELKYFALRRAAQQRFAAGRFEEAKGLFWRAKNYAGTDALSASLDEKIELCEFMPIEMQ